MTMGSATSATTAQTSVEPEAASERSRKQAWQSQIETFVGREEEMRILRGRIDDAISGKGSLALVSGEPGIGKTRLLTEASKYAEANGMRVLWGRCWEGEGAPAFWPWLQILRPILELGLGAEDDRRNVQYLMPSGSPRVPIEKCTDPSGPQAARFRVFGSVASLIEQAGHLCPTFILIDDIHWADDSSLHLLDFLASNQHTARAVFVTAYRNLEITPNSSLEFFVANASRANCTSRINLPGINAADLRALIPDQFPERVSLATSLTGLTDGNPLLLTEILRHFATAPDAYLPNFVPRSTPPTIRGLIDLRLAKLTSGAVRTLQAASICQHSFTIELLEQLGIAHERDIVEQIESAVRAALVCQNPEHKGEFTFRHSLIRNVLYDQLTSAGRSNLHWRLATVLEERLDTAPDEVLPRVAHHYFSSGIPETLEKAAHFNRLAAELATSHLAFEKAIPFFRNLLSILGNDESRQPEKCESLIGLGEAQLRSGLWLDARETFLAATTIARRHGLSFQFAEAAIGFKGTRGSAIPPDDQAIQLLKEALEAECKSPDARMRANLLSHLAMALYSSSESERAKVSHDALTSARECGDENAVALALVARAHSISAPKTYGAVLELMDELGVLASNLHNPELRFRRHLMCYMSLLVDADPRADFELARCNRVAEDSGHPTFLWQVSSIKVGRALAAGNIALATTLALETRELGQQVHDLTAEQYFAGHQFWISVLTGVGCQARPAIAWLLDKAPEAHILRAGLAYIDAQAGDRDAALATLRGFTKERFQNIPDDVFTLFTLALLAEVAVFENCCEAAELISLRLSRYRGKNVVFSWGALIAGNVSYFLGLIQLSQGCFEFAEELFREALAAESMLGASAFVARTQLGLAQAISGSGRLHDAQVLAQTALATYADLGLPIPHPLADGLDIGPAENPSKPNLVTRESPHTFLRFGDFWTVTFDNRTAQLRDSKGMQHLRLLLLHQGRDVPAIVISQDAQAAQATSGTVTMTPDPTLVLRETCLDGRALREYRSRKDALEIELADAESRNDVGVAEAVNTELEWLRNHLANAFRPGMRHGANPQLERARISVRNNLTAALKRIHKHHPGLGKHLDSAINTGRICSYRPERHTPWILE